MGDETTEKKLRTGFTTGAAAAASVKGALFFLLNGEKKSSVPIQFIGGGTRDIDIFSIREEADHAVRCSVIKDAGDDPDVTHRAEIGAVVRVKESDDRALVITGGDGVGKVTKPGLEIPPGEYAINSGPRKMITAVFDELVPVTDKNCTVFVEIFVTNGKELAKNTLNKRLGIIGGISILGTTGLVRPMSHDAYIATIRSSLSVARAAGLKQVFFTTGRRSERFAQNLFQDAPEEAFIQIGDFFKLSLEAAGEMGFSQVVLTVFFGKALKMAYGIPHTHAAKKELCMKQLSDWTQEITGNSELSKEILSMNTARQAFFLLKDQASSAIYRVGEEMVASARQFIGRDVTVRSVIFDFEGEVFYDSRHPHGKENL